MINLRDQATDKMISTALSELNARETLFWSQDTLTETYVDDSAFNTTHQADVVDLGPSWDITNLAATSATVSLQGGGLIGLIRVASSVDSPGIWSL